MQVKMATSRGFCFGVEDAIEIAEAAVSEHGAGKVVALGPVIHNKQVVSKLEQAGLNQSGDIKTIDPADAAVRAPPPRRRRKLLPSQVQPPSSPSLAKPLSFP